MTVIAAMDCGDYLLMGSDSLVTEETGIRVVRQKLCISTHGQVACGFAGSEGMGNQFQDWFLSYQFPPGMTWPEFGDVAIRELSRLNGKRRELALLARYEVKPDDLSSVLVAGSLGGVLDIWDLGDNGAAFSAKHRGFSAIGSGFPHAFVAHAVLTKAAHQSPDTNTMSVVMAIAAQTAPLCGMPIRLLRLTHEAVIELERQPDNSWREKAD